MSIMIWGHRGHRHHRRPDLYGDGQAHENSMRAYQETLSGCMGIECDVIQSKEATIYLAHDTLFNGIVHYELKGQLDESSKEKLGNRYIYQLSDAEIGSLKLKDGQEIPALRSLLRVMKNYPGRVLNLELKGPHTADVAVRIVEQAVQAKAIKPDQIVFSSFNMSGLRDLRSKIGPRFKIAAAFAVPSLPISSMYPNWPNAPQDASYIPFNLDENVLDRDDLRQTLPDYFSLELSCVTPETVAGLEAKYPKAKLIVWSASERHPSEQGSMIVDMLKDPILEDKVHAIISDFPREMQSLLARAGLNVATP